MRAARIGTLALVLALAGCATTTIYNVESAALPTAPTTSASDVAQVIREAGQRLGWSIEDVGPGELRGMLNRRRYSAVVVIHYDANSFSIHHVESSNLRRDGDQIHEAYNKWVRQLEDTIQREAEDRLSAVPSAAGATSQ